MDINTIAAVVNIMTPLATAAAAIVAAVEYVHTKNSEEQARYIAVYVIRLFNAADNAWSALMIAPAGTPDNEENRKKSMAFAVVIENNSQQPIRDFYAKIDPLAIERETPNDGDRSETHPEPGKVHRIARKVKKLKIIPPGKWVVSIDETSNRSQGFNSLEDVLEFNESTTRYNPIIRTASDPIKKYGFIDNMSQAWCYRKGRLNKSNR